MIVPFVKRLALAETVGLSRWWSRHWFFARVLSKVRAGGRAYFCTWYAYSVGYVAQASRIGRLLFTAESSAFDAAHMV